MTRICLAGLFALLLTEIPAPLSAQPVHIEQDAGDVEIPDNEPQADESLPVTGFIDLNGYYDTRDATGLTINLLAVFPLGIHYFSFVNFFSPVGGTRAGDQQAFYSEQNLRWAPIDEVPVDATVQWVIQSGGENDLLRLGLRWRVSDTPGIGDLLRYLNVDYSLNLHLLEFDFQSTDGYAFQLEHFYEIRFFPEVFQNRIYISGFLDHSLRAGASDPAAVTSRVVTEHQIGVRVVAGFHAVAELRYDEFLPSRRFGVGLGLEYLVAFSAPD